ncbi:uncharacterized protein LOC128017303 isoform X1 [Carassius gibelio]|uniref:uncharacterized protein LOC128017303 isoform X1 n=1 Tax=Carassius gibelio TaxID=101364 RepID=UPI00227883D7|nr:uncharacterized protein LOC128017303 isoform X1 [Carassius gibelio]
MLHISAVALFLFEMGLLRVMFSTASTQTHPGQRVTMWCSHNIHVSGYLYWFKQSDDAVPITIVYMLYTESLRKVEPTYFNNFTKDHLVMDLFNKVTTLTITQVKMSDSGFYFCGTTDYDVKFGNGTRLEVKGNVFEPLSLYSTLVFIYCLYHIFILTLSLIANIEKHHHLNAIENATMINDWPAVFITEKNYTGTSKKDHEQSAVSEECSRDIYFKLTLLFGGIISFTCIVSLILGIIREHRRQKHKKVAECQSQQQDDKENDSVEYAAVYFSNQRPKRAGRHTEDPISVYTDTT